jgi:hypothetical protein
MKTLQHHLQMGAFIPVLIVGYGVGTAQAQGIRQDVPKENTGFNRFNVEGKDDITRSASSVIDKLEVLDNDLKNAGKPVDWLAHYEDYKFVIKDPETITDKALLCILLGIKITDGTLALKGKDATRLNDCADTVEILARGLKVPQEDLDAGFKIKNAVNRGNWVEAFAELGMLQHSIMKSVKRREKGERDLGVMIVCGAWFQGARITVSLIQENYDGVLSNYLRAPVFVKLMKQELLLVDDPDLKFSKQLQFLTSNLDEIHKIVNVSMDHTVPAGWIPEQDLKRLSTIANQFYELNQPIP